MILNVNDFCLVVTTIFTFINTLLDLSIQFKDYGIGNTLQIGAGQVPNKEDQYIVKRVDRRRLKNPAIRKK